MAHLGQIECGEVEIEVEPSKFVKFTVLAQPNPEFPMVDRITIVGECGTHFEGDPKHAPANCAEAVARAKDAVIGMNGPDSGLISY